MCLDQISSKLSISLIPMTVWGDGACSLSLSSCSDVPQMFLHSCFFITLNCIWMFSNSLIVSLSPAVEPVPGSAPQQFQLWQSVSSRWWRWDEQPANRYPQNHQRPGLVPQTGTVFVLCEPVCLFYVSCYLFSMYVWCRLWISSMGTWSVVARNEKRPKPWWNWSAWVPSTLRSMELS